MSQNTRLLAALFLLFSVGTAWGDEPPPPVPNQTVENIRRQAVDLYNAGQYEAAENYFFKLLAVDPQSFLGDYAIGYLKKIPIESGALQSAIQKYRVLRETKDVGDLAARKIIRLPVFESLQDTSHLKDHLFKVFKFGGFLASHSTLISFLLDGVGLTEESNYYFDQAAKLVETAQELAYAETRDFLSERPLHYLMPPYYGSLGMPIYSVGQLQTILFERQQTELSNIELQRDIGGWHTHLTGAFGKEYDSNAIRLQSGLPAPTEFGRQDSFNSNILLNLGMTGNIARPLSYGWDFWLYAKNFDREILRTHNTISHLPSGWISWWDAKELEVRFRYDWSHTRFYIPRNDVYTVSHGPQLSVSYLLNERYRVDAAYSYKANRDHLDTFNNPAARGGNEHTLSLQGAYPGKSKRIEPYLKYVFDRVRADGLLFNSIFHHFETGIAYLLGRSSVIRFSSSYKIGLYPWYQGRTNGRQDDTQKYAIDFAIPFNNELLSILGNGGYETVQSSEPSLGYSRWYAMLGLSGKFSY